jgi:hypothetical protein
MTYLHHLTTTSGQLGELEYWTILWITGGNHLERELLFFYGTPAYSEAQLVAALQRQTFEQNRMSLVLRFEPKSDSQHFPYDLFDRFGCLGCTIHHHRIFAPLKISGSLNPDREQHISVNYDLSEVVLLQHSVKSARDTSELYTPKPDLASFMQNCVLIMGLSFTHFQIETTALQETLPSYVYLWFWQDIQLEHHQGTWAVVLSENTAFLNESHSGLLRHMLYSNNARTVPFDPDHGIAASDLLFLQPAKYYFPMPYAQIYSTRILTLATAGSMASSKGALSGVMLLSTRGVKGPPTPLRANEV